MMNVVFRVIVCCMLTMLMSCTSYHDYIKRSDDQTVCKIACQQRLQHCNQICHDNCRQCSVSANMSAANDYAQYLHQQAVAGNAVALQLKSFRDPLQCRKTTCECPADYRVCIQSCAGKIIKRLQAVPAC